MAGVTVASPAAHVAALVAAADGDIDVKDANGQTAVMVATRHRDASLLSYLLSQVRCCGSGGTKGRFWGGGPLIRPIVRCAGVVTFAPKTPTPPFPPRLFHPFPPFTLTGRVRTPPSPAHTGDRRWGGPPFWDG